MNSLFIYNAALTLAAPVIIPYMAARSLAKPAYRAGLSQKLGFKLPERGAPCVWIHAVSVGEVMAAEPLVRAIHAKAPTLPITVTVTTPTGMDVAVKRFSEVARVLYFPLDFSWSARRAVFAINPAIYVTIDTEIWPNVMNVCSQAGARVVLANGRISDRSYPRYRKMKWLFGPALKNANLLLMQDDEDVRRITNLGADPSRSIVAGNLKFDGLPNPLTPEDRAATRASLGIGVNDGVVVLGSLHDGEEEAIQAFITARKRISNARLVIAPRRVDNIEWIEMALKNSGLTAVRKTAMGANPPINGSVVPVIDTFGELSRIYGIADVAFVGGSLIAHGGQNPLEPAAHGTPVVFGPDMRNFRDASKALMKAGAAVIVGSEREIADNFVSFLSDEARRKKAGAAGLDVINRNRGVADRMADRILGLVG
ncbi:MAG: 3-deoxy-D-manno-octulosonic acid transferase [Nitrospinae bacterium]|nr:3-deoxy-D-manno-octulosonic acid transferase [Nitrospinota bacterium]